MLGVIDVAAAVTAVGEGNAAIAALGAASLLVVIGLRVWKRLRGAA